MKKLFVIIYGLLTMCVVDLFIDNKQKATDLFIDNKQIWRNLFGISFLFGSG